MKFCANCSKPASDRKRICDTCGGKAIWRAPTCEELKAQNEKNDRMQRFLDAVLRGDYDVKGEVK